MPNTYKPPVSAQPLDLRSAFLKVNRANKHIDDLGLERSAFLDGKEYFGVPKFDPETNRTQFVLERVPAIPDSIKLIVGDVAHNLRTALDHLASALVRSVGIEPKGVYFPIAETIDKYKAESGGKTKGMPQQGKDLIDRFSPYGGGNHLLWGLHKLDIIDKHRLLLTTTTKTGGWSVTLGPTPGPYNFAFLSDLKAGDVIGDVEGNHESDKKMGVTPDIALGEPEVFAGEAIFPTVTILANYVNWILLEFGPNPLLE